MSPTVVELLLRNFQEIDKDGSGTLSVDEILHVFRNMLGVAEAT